MSKVRINDLAREMEVKSRQVLDILAELGLGAGKTHSSSLEEDEADKVRAHFKRAAKTASAASTPASRAPQVLAPKIDLSHISKPGDVLKAVLAKKQEEEAEARKSRLPLKRAAAEPVKAPARPAPPAVVAVKPPAAPAKPEPRKIVPQPRSAPPIVAKPVSAPAIASRPPSKAVVAKAPSGAAAAQRPAVAVVPPAGAVVVKPPAKAAKPVPEHVTPAATTKAVALPHTKAKAARTAEPAEIEMSMAAAALASEQNLYSPEKPPIWRLLRQHTRPPIVERGTRAPRRPHRRSLPGAW